MLCYDKDKDLPEWFVKEEEFHVKNCTREFFREIATFISKTLSFDIFSFNLENVHNY